MCIYAFYSGKILTASDVLLGDIDGNGTLSILDVTLGQRHLVGVRRAVVQHELLVTLVLL